jgi:hypothetical protein
MAKNKAVTSSPPSGEFVRPVDPLLDPSVNPAAPAVVVDEPGLPVAPKAKGPAAKTAPKAQVPAVPKPPAKSKRVKLPEGAVHVDDILTIVVYDKDGTHFQLDHALHSGEYILRPLAREKFTVPKQK